MCSVDKVKEIELPAYEKRWAVCPYCRKKNLLYHNTACAKGIWVRCKSCRRDYELRIKDGAQLFKD